MSNNEGLSLDKHPIFRNQRESLAKSLDQKYASNKSKINQLAYFVRKMSPDEDSSGTIKKDVDIFFNSPDKYFQINSPITVGKQIKLQEIEVIKKPKGKGLKSSKKVGEKNGEGDKSIFRNMSDFSYISRFQKQKQWPSNNSNNIHFEVIDNMKLKGIFDSFKEKNISEFNTISNYNTNSNQQFSLENESNKDRLPFDLYNTLTEQNRRLSKKLKKDKEHGVLSKYFSKKTSKSEKDLLINRVESVRYKNEYFNQIENKKLLGRNYGKFNWYIGLRRPEKFIGVRKSYINLRNNEHPFWGIITENSPKQKELVIKPGYDLNNKDFDMFKQRKKIFTKNKNSFKTLENLDQISIKGKNLYELEYKREMDNKNKKILHNAFMENGKVILNSEINNLFGNQTIYKNYENIKLQTEPNKKRRKKIEN